MAATSVTRLKEGMRMGIRRLLQCTMVAFLAASAAACGTQQPQLSPGFRAKLDEFQREAGQALHESMERQTNPDANVGNAHHSRVQDLLPGETIWLQSGKSQVIRLASPARRVALGNPDLAGLVVVGPTTIVLNGKALPEEQADRSGIQVNRSGTILGRTLTEQPRFLETTLIVWRDDEMDIHPLIVGDFVPSQVMLEVTVAEVNRTALEQHGIDFRVVREDLLAAGFMGAGVPPAFSFPPAQASDPLLPLFTGAGGPTYALIFPDENVAAFIRALQTEGLASVLAQPKLTAMSGQNAVFQVGGEIPIRVSSGFVAEVEFKPFGTLVNFVPRITDDGDIFLTVTPEVSEADFAQTVEGIPTFRTRRASTTTRLRDGETLVIGGLLQTKIQEEVAGVPYLKDLPYIGYPFRTTRYKQEVTELMVVVKPTIVGGIAPGIEIPLPTRRGPLTRDEVKTRYDEAEITRPRLLPNFGGDDDEQDVQMKYEPMEATEPELPVLP